MVSQPPWIQLQHVLSANVLQVSNPMALDDYCNDNSFLWLSYMPQLSGTIAYHGFDVFTGLLRKDSGSSIFDLRFGDS